MGIRIFLWVLLCGACSKESGNGGAVRAECLQVLEHTSKLFDAEGMKSKPMDDAKRKAKLDECASKTTPEARACALKATSASEVMDCSAAAAKP